MSDELIDSQKSCPKCESRHWMTGLPVSARHSIYTHVGQSFWDGMVISTFQASVCGDCGYSELYAVKYEELWEEWRKKNT